MPKSYKVPCNFACAKIPKIGITTAVTIKPKVTQNQLSPALYPKRGGNNKFPAPKNSEKIAKPAIQISFVLFIVILTRLAKYTYFCAMLDSILFKNTKIAFSDKGKGTAVILLHGFLENSTMWKSILPTFVKKYRIITIDLLGHGNTKCLGYVHSTELMAEAVEAVLNHLKLRRFVLIGHSMGGYVSLALAERNPQKIKGLCLLNSTSLADGNELKKLRTRANKMIQNNFTNMVKIPFANLFSEESKTIFKDEMKLAVEEALKTPVQGYIACQEGMKLRKNRITVLKENNFKKLLIIGKKDPVLDFETSLQEAKETNSEVVVFPNGHMSHIENKTELIDALKGFLKNC